MKRGFTLIEVLIYIAISSVIITAFYSLSFAVIKEQNAGDASNEAEINGLYLTRLIENEIQNNAAIEKASTTLYDGIYNISFSIDNHDFTLSLPAKK